MKFPLFNWSIFNRSSSASSTQTNRHTTTFGHRKSSSTHRSKSGSSHRRASRKRSITYYSPSKSRFYPTEYFPTLQRRPLAVSTDVVAAAAAAATAANKLSQNRTYLCNDQDIIVHHDVEGLPHQYSHQNKQIDPRFYTASELYRSNDSNNNNIFAQKSTVNGDYNANGIGIDANEDAIVAAANQYERYSKECVGAPSSAFVMPDSHSNGNFYVNLKCDSSRPSYHHRAVAAHQSQTPQHLTANHLNTPNSVFNNSSGTIITANHMNSLFDVPTQYANSSNATLFHHSTMPIMKRHERHRRRRVCAHPYVYTSICPFMPNLPVDTCQTASEKKIK